MKMRKLTIKEILGKIEENQKLGKKYDPYFKKKVKELESLLFE